MTEGRRRFIRENWYRDVWLLGVTVIVLIAIVKQFNYIHTTRSSLCTFTADLQRRVDDGKAFLLKHPDGIPGVTRITIRNSLHNEQLTLNSLRGLKCDE